MRMSGVNKLKQTVKLHVMGIFLFSCLWTRNRLIFQLMMGLKISSPFLRLGRYEQRKLLSWGRLKSELYLWARNGLWGIYVNKLALPLGGVRVPPPCNWRAAALSPLFSGFPAACVFYYIFIFFSFDAIRKDERQEGGAAWLASCALVSHRPNQQLLFAEVSVTADWLSYFDLTVASEGTWPATTAESYFLAAWNARASILKE